MLLQMVLETTVTITMVPRVGTRNLLVCLKLADRHQTKVVRNQNSMSSVLFLVTFVQWDDVCWDEFSQVYLDS